MAAIRPLSSRPPSTLGKSDGTGGHHGISLAASLALVQALQTTLDVASLIDLFGQRILAWVPFTGLCYRYPELGLEHCVGGRAMHRCSYGLQLEGEPLGEIEFTHRSRFSEAHQAQLEALLVHLVHPLRNALCYLRVAEEARRDHLTGAYSRRALDDTLGHELDLAARHGWPLALLMFDLDHFKAINDHHGHQGGDQVLRSVVREIQGCIRASDQLFRYGGEEFVVLARNTPVTAAGWIAERIRARVEGSRCRYQGVDIGVTLSLGVTTHRAGDDATTLLARADTALGQVKTQGRNRVVVN
ncbi:MAG: GGDEF domain-containing protein [Pseudomonadales bacterium]|nr:GGDEF domain-containing protein [Pseudomonadales bacterium]